MADKIWMSCVALLLFCGLTGGVICCFRGIAPWEGFSGKLTVILMAGGVVMIFISIMLAIWS